MGIFTCLTSGEQKCGKTKFKAIDYCRNRAYSTNLKNFTRCQHLFGGRFSAALCIDQTVSGRDTQDLQAAPRHETSCSPRRDGTWADRQDTTIPPPPDLNPNPPA